MLAACQGLPKSFVKQGERFVHQPTGAVIPAKIVGWSTNPNFISEDVSPEVAAAVTYTEMSFLKVLAASFQPKGTVYVSRNKTNSGIAAAEMRMKNAVVNPQEFHFVGRKSVVISGRATDVAIYRHPATVLHHVGALVTIAESVPVESWLVHSAKQPEYSFWVTVARDRKEDEKLPVQFVQAFFDAVDGKVAPKPVHADLENRAD